MTENDPKQEARERKELEDATARSRALVSRRYETPKPGILDALLAALVRFDDYIAALRDRSKAASGSSDDVLSMLAELDERIAKQHEHIHEDAFRRAARDIARVLEHALATGQTEDVVWLAAHLPKRRRRHWLRTCEMMGKAAKTSVGPHGNLVASLTFIAEECIIELERIDSAAENLTADHVEHVLAMYARRTGPETPAGLASRLACDCNAFGYTDRDYERAKSAFDRLTG